MIKIDDLIHIPWRVCGRDRSGVDCWGLLRLAYMDLFDISLPKYDGVDPDDNKLVVSLVEIGKSDWFEVDHPQLGDVLLFFIDLPKLPTHCAMALDHIHMLHIRKDQPSCVEFYDSSLRGQIWKHRLTGIYRHVARMR